MLNRLTATLPLALAYLIATGEPADANDVQPRLYNNVPIGANFIGARLVRSSGSVLVDPSLVVSDVEAVLYTATLNYSRSFGVAGRSALLSIAVPYSDAEISGVVFDEFVAVTRRGRPDPAVRFAVNWYGSPALTPAEFSRFQQKTIVGSYIQIQPPLGSYDDSRVVNFSANRWTTTLGTGVSHRTGKITFEGDASWVFATDNDNYLGQSTIEQDDVLVGRVGVIYHFRPNLWLGVGGLYAWGGRTKIDGVRRNDFQKRSRAGFALSLPAGRRNNFVLTYTSGVTTNVGADFDNYGISYSFVF